MSKNRRAAKFLLALPLALLLLLAMQAFGGFQAISSFHPLQAAPQIDPKTVWVEDSSGKLGEVVSVPVHIYTGGTSVSDLEFDLYYDPNVLSYHDGDYTLGSIIANWPVSDDNIISPGHIRFGALTWLEGIPPGTEGILVTFDFTVVCTTCHPGDTSILNLDALDAGIQGYTAVDGVFTFTGPEPTSTPTPEGTPTPTPTPTPVPGRLVVLDVTGESGQQVGVTVQASVETHAMASLQFDLHYDPNHLDHVEGDYTLGSLIQGWPTHEEHLIAPGHLRFLARSTSGGVPPQSEGPLVTFDFTVTCASCQDGDTSSLELQGLSGDITGYDVQNGTFTFKVVHRIWLPCIMQSTGAGGGSNRAPTSHLSPQPCLATP